MSDGDGNGLWCCPPTGQLRQCALGRLPTVELMVGSNAPCTTRWREPSHDVVVVTAVLTFTPPAMCMVLLVVLMVMMAMKIGLMSMC